MQTQSSASHTGSGRPTAVSVSNQFLRRTPNPSPPAVCAPTQGCHCRRRLIRVGSSRASVAQLMQTCMYYRTNLCRARWCDSGAIATPLCSNLFAKRGVVKSDPVFRLGDPALTARLTIQSAHIWGRNVPSGFGHITRSHFVENMMIGYATPLARTQSCRTDCTDLRHGRRRGRQAPRPQRRPRWTA